MLRIPTELLSGEMMMFKKAAAGSRNRLAPESVLMLLGGKWPNGFAWGRVTHFRTLAPGMLQGFEADEPVGPALMYTLSQTDFLGKPILHFGAERLKWGRIMNWDLYDRARVRTAWYKGQIIGEYHSSLRSHPRIFAEFIPDATGQVLGLQHYQGLTILECINYISKTLGLSESDRMAALDHLGPNLGFHESAQQ